MTRPPPKSTVPNTLFPYTTRCRSPYGHDLPAFARALAANADVSLVFIANPNNPTGTVLQPREIEAFLTTTPSSVIVALDEAYFERSEEHTSERQSLMRRSYAVFCLKKKKRRSQP